MTLSLIVTLALALLGNGITIWLVMRSERKASEARTAGILQEMVSDKLDDIQTGIAAHEKRISDQERKHERLIGRLEGAGVLKEGMA